MNRESFGKAICLAGIALAFTCLMASYLSWFWIEFDVLSHFTLHLCLVIFALAIAYFASKPIRVPVAIGLVIAGMIGIGSWSRLGPDQLPPVFNEHDGARVLKIMHFNTWGRNGQIKAIADEVSRIDPDVLFLTEFGRRKQGLQAMLEKRFPHRLPENRPPGTNLQMYSKYPFADSYVSHRSANLAVIRATLDGDWDNLNIVGTHMNRPTDTRDQEREIRALSKLVAKLKGANIIVGDFNATPHSVMLAILQSRTGMHRVTNLPTWPAVGPNLPQLSIDHMFISDGLKLLGPAIVGRRAGSDHLPIAASIVVRQSN